MKLRFGSLVIRRNARRRCGLAGAHRCRAESRGAVTRRLYRAPATRGAGRAGPMPSRLKRNGRKRVPGAVTTEMIKVAIEDREDVQGAGQCNL
jgi:hypothetical protein